MPKDPTGRIEVFDKIVAILAAFRDEEALTPFEIACETDLPVSTVYRLVQALEMHGWLQRNGKHYRLGLAMLHLGALVAERIDLRQNMLPFLRRLSEEAGENAELQVRQEQARIVIEGVNSDHNLRPIVHIGQSLPLHLGSGGRVLLAWLPPAEQLALAKASAAHFHEWPLEPEAEFFAKLACTREQGYYTSDGERTPGIGAISAPIFDTNNQVVGAMTLAAPSIRLTQRQRATLTPVLLRIATEASRSLGFRGSYPGSGVTSIEEEMA